MLLKDYILTLNHARPIAAKNNLIFFVNVFKLLQNSTYGKFQQNSNEYTYPKPEYMDENLITKLTPIVVRASSINQAVAFGE